MLFNEVCVELPLIELRALLAFTERAKARHATHRPDRYGWIYFDPNVGVAGAFDARRMVFAPADRFVDVFPWRPFGASAAQIDRLIRTNRANAVFGREATVYLAPVGEAVEFTATFHQTKAHVDATHDVASFDAIRLGYGDEPKPVAAPTPVASFDPKAFADLELIRRSRAYDGEDDPPVDFFLPATPFDPVHVLVGAGPAAWHVALMPLRSVRAGTSSAP